MRVLRGLVITAGLLPLTLAAAAAADLQLPTMAPPTAAPPTVNAEVTAQALTPAPVPQTYQTGPSGVEEYFLNWFNRVDATQAEQPHWMTPLVTVTPRLEEEFRYDQYWEHSNNNSNSTLFDSGKGLELIPDETNEILINLPPYEVKQTKKSASGWGDWPFLTIKQRLLSANEENGNYIVTAFLGFQAPTGITPFTEDAWIITPTIAGGKGWGDFDVQSTLGLPVPTSHENTIGTSLLWNTAFQYHFARVVWPEIETSVTHWFDGERGGHTQVLITPGVIFGRFPLFDSRARLIIGGGYQVAITPGQIYSPALTPIYNHAWIATARVAF